jgi:hypothetical protein
MVTLRNHASIPVSIQHVLYAKLPSGKEVVVAGPFSLNRPAGSVLTQPYSLTVPNGAPLGVYRVFGQVKSPDSLDEDFIEGEVVP